MDLPTLISKAIPFPILGVLSGVISFVSSFNRTSGDTDQTPLFDLGLHCLSMSDKNDTRLIWVTKDSNLIKNFDLTFCMV